MPCPGYKALIRDQHQLTRCSGRGCQQQFSLGQNIEIRCSAVIHRGRQGSHILLLLRQFAGVRNGDAYAVGQIHKAPVLPGSDEGHHTGISPIFRRGLFRGPLRRFLRFFLWPFLRVLARPFHLGR